MPFEQRIMVGRGPDYLPRVMEVDADGYLTGVGTLVTHVPQFGGTIWYVQSDAPAGGDGNADTPLATIIEAIAAATAGDAIVVGAGTYTEIGLDLNKKGLELWPAMGVVISPASGPALTVSGHYCKIWCPGGSLFLEPPANQTGLLVSGNRAYVSDVRTNCASTADLGFDLQGNGAVLDNCRCAAPLVAAFKVQGDKIKLKCCGTGGVAGDSSIGYWVTDSCDLAWLDECTSRGHETAGYQVDAGCTHGTVKDCSSGGGDGRWIDVDNAFVWSNFTFDDIVYKAITMDGSLAYNLFQVTGAVRLTDILGHVESDLENVSSQMHLEIYSTNGSVDITLSPGVDLQNAGEGSLIVRNAPSDENLDIGKLTPASGGPATVENVSWKDPKTSVDVVADQDATTYIRAAMNNADMDSGGVIHWHCTWFPLIESGFVEAA